MKRASILLLTLGVLLLGAGPAAANEVTALRHSSSGGKIRLVIDLKEAPVYQVYTESSPARVVVEVLDTDPTLERPGRAPRNGLVTGWRVEQPNLRRFRWVVTLKAPIDGDRVKAMALDDPHRIVVDLETAYDTEEVYKVSPGVTWLQRETFGGARGYMLWNEIVFDPADPHVHLDVALANDRLDSREKVSAMVRRTGALAGINGGFFASSGGPLGLVVREGRVLAPHVGRRPPRTVLGVTKAGEVRFDRVAARGQQLSSRGGQDWSDVVLACGGGPRLLHRGQVSLTTDEEGLGPKGNDITRVAGRTAVGTMADGRMMMVTASGYRDNHREGVKLDELAVAMLRRGAREAMNFDGGASVDMVIGGRIVSDGPGNKSKEKPVATALLLFDDRPATHPERLVIDFAESSLPADGAASTEVTARVLTPGGDPVPDGTPVVFEADGAVIEHGATTKAGAARVKLTSLRSPGLARVYARSGKAAASAYVKLEPGAPQRITARLEPGRPGKDAPPDTRTLRLTALVEDGWFNSLEGTSVGVAVDGQTLGAYPTAANGELDLDLSLPYAQCEVMVWAEGVTPVRLPVQAAPAPEPSPSPSPSPAPK